MCNTGHGKAQNRSNTDALTLDTKPDVLKTTALAHAAYLARLPAPSTLATWDVLEIGSGTGLLSLALASAVRSLTAVNAAEGMIAVLRAKLRAPGAPPQRRGRSVVSNLVLHHVADLGVLFKTVWGCLKPGGEVMVTDFEDFGPEARRFHPEARMDGVHWHGIKRDAIRAVLEGPGFGDVSVETGFEMEKMVLAVPGNGVKEHKMVFSFLICRGRRPAAG
ncbi:S-adenosyl-L-methionine-dependent methyltransferase [Lasiosphaeria hispida]|uniref:S-adenosyl-L-methionine-dependent methyltransferase n=1 Tax=Lasiosphaeria hispida TaxID=260671 RepID=A0AAJ0MBZ1_9PEZI|nr:S-adenosyl-L-methionine-dependent methyltransferase [Lasiosphaeria hispida]